MPAPKLIKPISAVNTPRIDALEMICRERTPNAVAVLESIMLDPLTGPIARITAAKTIIEAGYGRPAARITAEVNMNSGGNSIMIEHIANAEEDARMTLEVTKWSRLGIPFDQWPEDVKAHSGFLISQGL